MSWESDNYPKNDDSVCPVCGNLMEKGFIVSDRGIYWREHIPRFIVTGNGMGPHGRKILGFSYVEAFRCRDCRIIRHLYEEKPLDLIKVRCNHCGETNHYSQMRSSEDVRYCQTCASQL